LVAARRRQTESRHNGAPTGAMRSNARSARDHAIHHVRYLMADGAHQKIFMIGAQQLHVQPNKRLALRGKPCLTSCATFQIKKDGNTNK
jgi:hypothetical protein